MCKYHRSQKQQVVNIPGSAEVDIAVSHSLTPLQRRQLCNIHTDVPPTRELGASARCTDSASLNSSALASDALAKFPSSKTRCGWLLLPRISV
ncbi:hypothetical protein VTO73DRAFT_15397 [Trametes versicolor]